MPGLGLRLAGPDVVAFELAVEGGPADAQHLSRERLVAFHLLEDACDGGAFDVLEIGSASAGMTRSRCPGLRERAERDRWRQIVEVDGPAVAQGDGALDAILQLAHIPGQSYCSSEFMAAVVI